MVIFKRFRFEAAHRLDGLPHGHKCGRMHGHSWLATVAVEGPVDDVGFVIDFATIKEAWNYSCGVLDHSCLNDLHEIGNPTCEHVALWIWKRLKPKLPQMISIEIAETCTSGVIYHGEDSP